jgi:hypothetical protein
MQTEREILKKIKKQAEEKSQDAKSCAGYFNISE